MPITSAEILRKLTVKTGTAGNTTAGTPNGSLGKYVSTTQITDAVDNNLFDDITGDENAASTVDYRAEAVHNSNASLTLQGTKAWISAEVAGGASIAIAVDTTAASAVGATAAQLLEIATETTAPTGLTFASPTTKAAGVTLGDIPAGNVKGLWWRRTAANTAALNADGATVRVEGDTAQ